MTPRLSREAAIVEYYRLAGDDYAHWSADMHMHFGYCRRGAWPWQRSNMLRALSHVVHARLALAPDQRGCVVDLGCGVGSSARELALAHAELELLGVTLVPEQVERGLALARAAGLERRVRLCVADYRKLPVPDAALVGAYAIESSCYDPSGGAALIREAARCLRPGARLVVADAFRRRSGALPRHAARCLRGMSEGWVLPGLAALDEFVAALRDSGFVALDVADISWRVAPSLLHVPLAVLGFRLAHRRESLALRRRGNLHAPLWCLASALLAPRQFGYFLITATRG